MGVRTSDARRIPGNPLGGVLRATSRAARNGPRKRAAEPEEDFVEEPVPVVSRAVSVPCETGGRVRWVFSSQLKTVPVVVAVAVADRPVTVTITEVTDSAVWLALWELDGTPAPEGTMVHLILHDPR